MTLGTSARGANAYSGLLHWLSPNTTAKASARELIFLGGNYLVTIHRLRAVIRVHGGPARWDPTRGGGTRIACLAYTLREPGDDFHGRILVRERIDDIEGDLHRRAGCGERPLLLGRLPGPRLSTDQPVLRVAAGTRIPASLRPFPVQDPASTSCRARYYRDLWPRRSTSRFHSSIAWGRHEAAHRVPCHMVPTRGDIYGELPNLSRERVARRLLHRDDTLAFLAHGGSSTRSARWHDRRARARHSPVRNETQAVKDLPTLTSTSGVFRRSSCTSLAAWSRGRRRSCARSSQRIPLAGTASCVRHNRRGRTRPRPPPVQVVTSPAMLLRPRAK